MIQPLRVQIVHADPVVAAGLHAALRDHPEFDLRHDEARHAGAAHVVVTDYAAGLALAARPPRAGAGAVLVVTQRQREWEIRRALEEGVRGYLLLGSPIDELVAAVRALGAGLRHIGVQAARLLADSIAREALTPREEDVLRLVGEGRGNKAIARDLDIGVGTVKTHLRSIYQKLEAATRTEAVTKAARRGLLDRQPPPATPARGFFPTSLQ